METTNHPTDPRSNISKLGSYDPEKYVLDNVSSTVLTDESLTPGRPPCLTQRTIGKFLQPLTRELAEIPPKPTIDELPGPVIERMVQKDKAFWVDKPGSNAYVLHDAYNSYGMTTETVIPHHQDVFPRSYQYDLDCIKYRRDHACDGLKQKHSNKPIRAQCRDCTKLNVPGLSPFQLAWAKDPGQKRWRDYPDVAANMTKEEIRLLMTEVGRPFQNEACNWYYENYPPVTYDCILRKFSK
ncbi:uncharacterized protein LOC101746303 isoform X2 [Bombyx mori]|uniref:Uncharacterized protein n=1 Tax=Bombyx mori TaxID=7091 RepID=A0A8R2GA02_BOMMO|nr:uncharacterized protein LOC101746303 isoform X2 [Bombyx mori]